MSEKQSTEDEPNALQRFFDRRLTGSGIWKWRHYFEVYDRHFRRFRGQEVHFLEIGVYSGGSLEMWIDYFGPQAHVYGVDIEPACRLYEKDRIKIFIGDQADRQFWAKIRQQLPRIDIVVDDGGHLPIQQAVSLQELLPHLAPGGIYCCEDVVDLKNEFSTFVHGLAQNLNAYDGVQENLSDPKRRLAYKANAFQADIHSFHFYPFMAVIEKNATKIDQFVAPKHGTQWQPFLR